MKVRTLDSAAQVAEAAADFVAAEAAAQPDLVLAFPTGKTPLPMFQELAARHTRGALNLGRVTTFQLDELRLPLGDPRTFRVFLQQHAWSKLGISDARCLFPDAMAEDADAECLRYEERIRVAGGLDLCVLGLGVDGHVAYNLPRPPRLATHLVDLPDAVADENGVPPAQRPLRAVTMGLATLGRARKLLLLATGASKAQPIEMLATRFEDPDWPCSFLARHPGLTVLVDRAAAARL